MSAEMSQERFPPRPPGAALNALLSGVPPSPALTWLQEGSTLTFPDMMSSPSGCRAHTATGEEAASPKDCSLVLEIGFSNPHQKSFKRI